MLFFAERISSKDYISEPNKIVTDVSKNKDFEYITYRLKNLIISENDIIFVIQITLMFFFII